MCQFLADYLLTFCIFVTKYYVKVHIFYLKCLPLVLKLSMVIPYSF